MRADDNLHAAFYRDPAARSKRIERGRRNALGIGKIEE
jgi:hypothetical protein